MVRKLIIALGFLIMMSGPAFAQKMKGNNPERHNNHKEMMQKEMRKEVREFKIQYLIQEMELNSEQKSRFTALYTNMENERHQLFITLRQTEQRIKDSRNPGDEEYEKVTKTISSTKEKSLQIEKKYDAEFEKFLSPKQIYKMKNAEESFRRKMRNMRKKKQ